MYVEASRYRSLDGGANPPSSTKTEKPFRAVFVLIETVESHPGSEPALRSSQNEAWAYNQNMYYVYTIRSHVDGRIYVGFSNELKQRVKAHNTGQSKYTAKYKPWDLIFYSAFEKQNTAKEFEQYLKSHSGKAFANKHLFRD